MSEWVRKLPKNRNSRVHTTVHVLLPPTSSYIYLVPQASQAVGSMTFDMFWLVCVCVCFFSLHPIKLVRLKSLRRKYTRNTHTQLWSKIDDEIILFISNWSEKLALSVSLDAIFTLWRRHCVETNWTLYRRTRLNMR